MLERRSLKAPIALGVVMIVLVIILAAVWIFGNVLGATGNLGSSAVFWVMLATGAVLLAGVLGGRDRLPDAYGQSFQPEPTPVELH